MWIECDCCKTLQELKDRYEEGQGNDVDFRSPCATCRHNEEDPDTMPCAFCVHLYPVGSLAVVVK